MEEIKKTLYCTDVVKYEWSTESFNHRTGMNVTDFKPNRHHNEVI